MSISMYSASKPIFERMLMNLSQWLTLAQAHASSQGYDVNVLMQARLYPDMLPLAAQVRIACDTAKLCMARLSGVQAPVFEDNETQWSQLLERIERTLQFVREVPASTFQGAEDKPVSVPIPNAQALKFDGETYLKHFALPNFFFHVTTAYGLLRHNGVSLGKRDFLGGG